MNQQQPVIVGVFEDAADARVAIHDLRDAGFSDNAVGLLTRDKDGSPEVKPLRELEGNNAAAGAAIGAVTGASGGALWAIGIAAGVLPGIGPIIGGGVLMAVAASAAAGVAGGAVVGALIGLGVKDEDAAYYSDELARGRTIVVVTPGKRPSLVASILRGHGAVSRTSVEPGSLAARIASSVR